MTTLDQVISRIRHIKDPKLLDLVNDFLSVITKAPSESPAPENGISEQMKGLLKYAGTLSDEDAATMTRIIEN